MKSRLFALMILLAFATVGCATQSYFGIPNKAWKAPKAFDSTQAAIEKAAASEGAQYCPEKLDKARALAKEGVETFWACNTTEAYRILAEARKVAAEVEQCQAPVAAPTPAPTPVPAPTPKPVAKAVVLQTIYFEFDKAELTPVAQAILDDNAAALLANPEITVEVAGHTCNIGTEEYNQKLSERRAQAAIDYLVKKGVARSRMVLVGYGETRPAYPNDSKANRSQNRRVEFIVQ